MTDQKFIVILENLPHPSHSIREPCYRILRRDSSGKRAQIFGKRVADTLKLPTRSQLILFPAKTKTVNEAVRFRCILHILGLSRHRGIIEGGNSPGMTARSFIRYQLSFSSGKKKRSIQICTQLVNCQCVGKPTTRRKGGVGEKSQSLKSRPTKFEVACQQRTPQ